MTDAPRSPGGEEAGPCPPDLILERHLAKDLSPDSPHAAHVSACSLCKGRLVRMVSEGDAYMRGDAAMRLRRLLAEQDRSVRRRRSVLWWGAAAPLAAAAAWIALVRSPAPDDSVAKGSGKVELLVGHAGQVAPWSGGALAQGDPLQLSWTSARAGYVAVIGREDEGETARWFPEDDRATRLDPGTRTLGGSLRFDPPFAGTIYVLVGQRAFPTGPLEAAIREGREPAFPGETTKLRVPRGL